MESEFQDIQTRRQLFRGTRVALGSGLIAEASLAAGVAQGAQGPEVHPGPVFSVRDYKAAGDGKVLDTAAIQAAIDACTQAGGGYVYFPMGGYLTGTIVLKDNVTLYLSPQATLLGSQNIKDYQTRPFPARDLDVGGFDVWPLIFAERASNIGIEGKGTIDGQGKPFPYRTRPRPRMIFLRECTHVTIRDVTLKESSVWTLHLSLCDKIFVQGISVYSSFFYNQDGIVLDSCRDACVSDCYVNTYDDCIVIKSSFPKPSTNISITNCVVTSPHAAGLKFGTQSLGGFRNVSISNCACYDCWLGGLKILTVDGGDLEDLTISNLSMHNVMSPIFFRRGNRGQDYGFAEVQKPRPVAKLKNVLISGLRATVMAGDDRRNHMTMGIAGIPGHPVENVVLENIHVTFPGGGTLEEARRTNIPERESAYPGHQMFGVLPAYGLYMRHARGVTLQNVRIELQSPDMRPALICDDVEDLELLSFKAAAPSGPEPLIRLRETRSVLMQGCRPLSDVDTFLHVEGEKSAEIALLGNDLRRARRAYQKSDGFGGQIHETGNLTTAQ